MFQNFNQLNDYLQTLRTNDYQRDNFDKFLHKIKFKFNIPAIHVAGTNGKGSVTKIINDIYVKHGYKVGLYQSPYFISQDETILINNKGIEVSYFDKIITKYQKEIKKYNLSQFEVETFVAFNFFLENDCDICVIECGMGGETDATNIFTPILSIITSVSLEHTDFLGSSISEIALNKAGIIKDNVPCLIGKLPEDAKLVIASECQDYDSRLIEASLFYNEELLEDGYTFLFKPYQGLKISSKAYYSLGNASIALTAIQALSSQFEVNEDDIRYALKHFSLPGRLTEVSKAPRIILDGGHNPEGSIALKESLEKMNLGKLHIVFASFKDKNVDTMISELGVLTSDITLTTFPHQRARNEEHYFLYLQDYKYEQDCFKAINDLINQYPNDTILVTGSLAFVGYINNNLSRLEIKHE